MNINLVGAFKRNFPFGTEIAFKKGLESIKGITVNCIDPSYENELFDYDADFTIVFKTIEGKYREELKLCSGKKIVFQPDDMRFPQIMHMMHNMREVTDYALTFDEKGAESAKSIGFLKTRKLLVTADPDLYRPIEHLKKDIDVSFVGSLSGGQCHQSRQMMCNIADSLGIKTCFVTGLYDIEKLNEIYNRSKIVLNHATDVGQRFGTGYGYQCRHFEAGFAGAFILSNTILDNAGEIKSLKTFSSEKDFVYNLMYWLRNDDERENARFQYFEELYTSHTPICRAAELFSFLVSL